MNRESTERERIRKAVETHLPQAGELLRKLIGFSSTPGEEQPAIEFFERELKKLNGRVEPIPFQENFSQDPEYSYPLSGISYEGRYNLRFERSGSEHGPSLLFNAHMDVVPPSEGMDDPWGGRKEGDTIHGRGACDDKGPLVAVWLMFRALDELELNLPGKLVFHVVNEEENGGNGTLAMIRHGENADGCIVMEPSAGKLYTSVRGAVWFRIRLFGKAGHSGQAGRTRSALAMARQVMDAMEDYHSELLKESGDLDLFDQYENPMPLTFGRLAAGNWPAAAPSEALLEGVLGFLPNRNREQICLDLDRVLHETVGLKKSEYELEFTYRHDCSVTDPASDLPASILEASRRSDVPVEVSAFPASCDAWFYPHFLSIPTVVYGPGDLQYAHSKEEQIDLAAIGQSAELLIHTVKQFSTYSMQ